MRPSMSSVEPADYDPRHSWLGRATRSNVFAWAISLCVHAAVFGALYVAVFDEEAGPKRMIIPEARLAGQVDTSSPKTSMPLRLSRQDVPIPLEKTDVKLDELPIAAIRLDEGPTVVLPATGSDGASSLTSGALASSVRAGPVTSFFGEAGNAYRIVYVVDWSQSLGLYFDDIVAEMRRSIGALVPTQRFHLVLAIPPQVREFGPKRLVPALRKFKGQAETYLKDLPRWEPGRADPIEAMRRAFAAGPELIYFLSDGDYRDVEEELEKTLKELNRDQAVKITVIGFSPRPTDQRLLERIARQHGGHFRLVEPR